MAFSIPEEERIKEGVWEKCYIPEKDNTLLKLGIEVCAKTYIENNEVKNRVVFKRGDKSADIQCIHAAICQISKSEETESGWEVVSTERRPELKKLLSAEDQFFALKSFTQALIENGVEESLLKGMKERVEKGTEPFDMNDMMRSQLIKALVKVAPEETKDLSLTSLEYIVADDPKRFELFSKDFASAICDPKFLEDDIRKLDTINGGILHLHRDIQVCLSDKILPDDILNKLISTNDKDIIKRLWYTEVNKKGLPTTLARMDEKGYKVSEWAVTEILKYMKENALGHRAKLLLSRQGSVLPISISSYLMDEGDVDVRTNIAGTTKIRSTILVNQILNDKPTVKIAYAKNPNIDFKTMASLCYDVNDDVKFALASRKDINLEGGALKHLYTFGSKKVKDKLMENYMELYDFNIFKKKTRKYW